MTPPTTPLPPTCDLCDRHKADISGAFRVLPPPWLDFGGLAAFQGEVSTVQCFEDNSRVKDAVESPGHGRVLVVDGGGSLRRALLGGNLAAAAAKNGWAGLVIHGAVRDRAELRQALTGIKALASVPMATERRGEGRRDLPIAIHGIAIRPGDWLVADEDGIVVLASAPA